MKDLLSNACARALKFVESLAERRTAPDADAIAALRHLTEPLPNEPTQPDRVLALLDELGTPATVASAGPRYYGFVTGGVLPAALAASWLAAAWDQNTALSIMSPAATALEATALEWSKQLLGLPESCAGAFVTGATMANFSAVCAARHALLQRQGWDVEAEGIFGAPPINVVVGDHVHASMLKALTLAGLGRERVTRVPVDDQGRMIAGALPELTAHTILCIQAGNVDSGAFDQADQLCDGANEVGAWVHVDGAFGLWAAASPTYQHLTAGFDQADSWATDAHKYLNIPYDCGIVFVRERQHLAQAMSVRAAYLIESAPLEPSHLTPEMSRRARGIEVWAAIKQLGRSGLAELINGTCQHARRFADAMIAAGYEVLNDVVVNQVLVAFGDDETTRAVIGRVQSDGTCWCGGTTWFNRHAMRVSVSCWATTAEDIDRSISAVISIADDVTGKRRR
jgi:glutamate/tyrosine decarboxylase-like PLP-dependent enzyme